MRIVDALKDVRRTRELLDPSSHKFSTGTEEQRAEARREWYRLNHIRRVVASDRAEIPRSELAFRKFGIVEHLPTGDFYRRVGGDPEFLPAATAATLDRPCWCLLSLSSSARFSAAISPRG